MQNKNKKKICLVVSSLGKGGAERSAAIISRILHNLGHEIHVVTILDDIQYDYKGKLLNLGLLDSNSSRFFRRFSKLKTFSKYLKNNDIEYIIDNRSRSKSLREILIYKFIFRKYKVISMVHSFYLKAYMPQNQFLTRYMYSNVVKFAAVSKEIKTELEHVYGFSNVVQIYNAVDVDSNHLKSLEQHTIDYKYILFYGRLDNDVKNLDLLIEAYIASKLSTNNVKLIILGNGKDAKYLKDKVSESGFKDHIKFVKHKENPFPYIKNATTVVLSSKHEGFPMVIPESLSLGVPVISVDCKSGPKEIIKNEYNGLLVENNNPEALAKAMNRFIFEKELLELCKHNAKKSVAHLSLSKIEEHWSKLFI